MEYKTRRFQHVGDCILFSENPIDLIQYKTLYMEWNTHEGDTEPRLIVYNDGWSEITQFSDIWYELSKPRNQQLTQDQFIQILREHGFEDIN